MVSLVLHLQLHHSARLASFPLQSDPPNLTLPVYFLSKKLSQPGVFPIMVQDDELQWKVSLNYDASTNQLVLNINDRPFISMPY